MNALRPPTRRPNRTLLIVARVVVLAGLFALAFILWIAHHVIEQATHDETRHAGAIVVFGAAEYAGRPSPVLRARLDHAYDVWL